MKYMKGFISVAFATIIFCSCTEKIDLKIKDSEPQLVIEANVSDKPGPYFVILSKSRLYNENNDFTGVSGAQVVISDNAGNADTLTETAPGIYTTNTLQGTAGRVYQIKVTTEGITYESVCTMRNPVDIDSLFVREDVGLDGNTFKEARVRFTDPAGVENFYRRIAYKNGVMDFDIDIHRDRLWDGKQREYGAGGGDLKTGDTITLDLLSLDEHIYTFFNEFETNSGFATPAAPANPNSVFTPSALGYFSAHSVKSRTIIVP